MDAKVEAKIGEKVEKSLFIPEATKERLRKDLKNATKSEKEELLALLNTEEDILSASVEENIKNKGQAGIDEMNQILLTAKNQTFKEQEEKERKEDLIQAEKILENHQWA